ncbi:hypothetical protein AB3F22_13210 [Actinomyces johnsonii]
MGTRHEGVRGSNAMRGHADANQDDPRRALSGRRMTRDRLPGTGPPAQVVSDAAWVDRSRVEERGSGKKDAAAVLRAALPGRAL